MVPELLAHLDILSFCHIPHGVIVVHSGKDDLQELVEPACYKRIEPKGHSLGALLALTAGIRVARENGFRYVCFRNGDDWIMNQGRVEAILNKLKNDGYKLAGYNWFGSDNFSEFALNELYIDLDALAHVNLDEWDEDFCKRVNNDCEKHLVRMLRMGIAPRHLYRIPGRERWDGIGFVCWTKTDVKNNRFFNYEWQLIADHDDNDRRWHWGMLKPLIPYADELMDCFRFRAWHDRIPLV